MLLLAGCAGPPPVLTVSASQQAVTAIELDYVNKFLVPAAGYTLLPRCPRPAGTVCSDPALVATLHNAQTALHNSIYALRDFTNASPHADATALIANARSQLTAAEAMIPATKAAP
jgi:uncharacterized lipoprotein YajG